MSTNGDLFNRSIGYLMGFQQFRSASIFYVEHHYRILFPDIDHLSFDALTLPAEIFAASRTKSGSTIDARKHNFKGGRDEVRTQSVVIALQGIRERLRDGG